MIWGSVSQPGQKVQPRLASAHARLSVHVLGILNHVMGEHRPHRGSATPNSLLRAIKLFVSHAGPAPLTKRPDREAAEVRVGGERGYGPPAPMADGVRQGGGLEQRDATQESSEEAKLERVPSACRHAEGVRVAARNFLAELRSAGNEAT